MVLNFKEICREIVFVAVRSRGPGGQNVNKVSSAVQLYWNYISTSLLNDEQKKLVQFKLKNSINKESEIFIRCDEFRDFERNKKRGIEKLHALLLLALHKPKFRKPTRPSYSSKEKKLDSKTKHGANKRLRRKVSDE